MCAAASSTNGSFLGSRVGGIQNATEPFLGDVSVVLSRRKVGVTEHLLHSPQIGPSVEEVGGEGVA